MDLILISSCILLFLFSMMYFKQKIRSLKIIPGPKGYPFIGNTLDIDFNVLHIKLHEWSKLYGEIFQVNVLGRNLVVLNTSEINRTAFLKEPNATTFADRIPGMVGKDFFYDFHDMGFAPQNKDTIRRRKLVYRLVKAYGDGMRVIEHCIHEELDVIMQLIEEKKDFICSAEEIVNRFIAGVLITLIWVRNVLRFGMKRPDHLVTNCQNWYENTRLTGHRYGYNSDLISAMILFDSQLTRMMNPGVDFLLKWFPFIKRCPCQVATEYKKTKESQKEYFRLLFEEMKLHPSNKGILHELFEAKETETDSNCQPWLTMDDIMGMLTDISAAAILTTKGSSLSLLRCLIDHPHVQEKLQKEVDKVVGRERKPTLADRQSMPYYDAVLTETLRLISHVPLSVPHGARDDAVLHGYDIPKGTTVISNLWAVHHNDAVYKDPFKFDPQRFLDADDKLLPHDSVPMQNFMAFGLGKRSCVGENFARGRLFLFLSTIMQNYTLLPDPDNPLPQFDPAKLNPGIVMVPSGYTCKFVKREH